MKRLLWIASSLLLVGLFLAARNAASWRPQPLPISRTPYPDFQFSPDGRWLLIEKYNPQKSAVLWDWRESRLVRTLPFGFREFSPDGHFLARASTGMRKVKGVIVGAIKVEIAETQSGRVVKTFYDFNARPFDSFQDARWMRDGKQLVVATAYGCRTFDVASGNVVTSWGADIKRAVNNSTLSPDGRQIARMLPTNSEIRRTDNGQFVSALPFGERGTILLGFAPDSDLIYSVPSNNNGKVIHHFWGAKKSRQKLQLVATVAASSFKPHFTRTPNVLAFATSNGIELREIPGSKVVKKLRGPTSEPFALAPDEASAVSCDARGQIYRWRLR